MIPFELRGGLRLENIPQGRAEFSARQEIARFDLCRAGRLSIDAQQSVMLLVGDVADLPFLRVENLPTLDPILLYCV